MIDGSIFTGAQNKNPDMKELFSSFENCYAPTPVFIGFWVQLSGRTEYPEVRIGTLDHESGEMGKLWIKGFLRQPHRDHTHFVAYFNVKTGTGHMKLLRSEEQG